MQVFGLPSHIIRNGRAASRLLDAKTPQIEAARRRDADARRRALARSPSDSLTAWEITMRAGWITRLWRLRASALLSASKGRCVQAGESRTAVARALGVTMRTMDVGVCGASIRRPEGEELERSEAFWRATGAAALAR
jgi:hypothetical protein